jgi:hypothetical protein
VDLQLSTNQTRQEKQEDFINLDNSKAKICRTKTNFSSSPSASSFFFFSACLVNRWETVGKQSCGFPNLNDQRRQEKQEDFILLGNSKAKTCRDKTSSQKTGGKKKDRKRRGENRNQGPRMHSNLTNENELRTQKPCRTKLAEMRRSLRQEGPTSARANAPKIQTTPKRTET